MSLSEAPEQSSAPLRSFPFINVRQAGLFLTASDGGMRYSFVRRKNKTVSVSVRPRNRTPGKYLVNRSFFETLVEFICVFEIFRKCGVNHLHVYVFACLRYSASADSRMV